MQFQHTKKPTNADCAKAGIGAEQSIAQSFGQNETWRNT